MARAYAPEAVFARFEHQVRETYPNRIAAPVSRERASWRNIRRALHMLRRILVEVGLKGDYRRVFWKFAWPRIKAGDIERIIHVGMVAHHLIVFAREASVGRQNASFYSRKLREAQVPAE